jgi:hypothetical protein
MQGDFLLTSSMTNNVLGSATIPRINSSTELNPSDLRNAYSYLGAEKISYIILQNASQSITDTISRPYSLIGDVHGDFGFYPEAADTFLYNMFRISPYHFGTSELESVPYMPLTSKAMKPVDKAGLKQFIKYLPNYTSDDNSNVQGAIHTSSLLEPALLVKDSGEIGITHLGSTPSVIKLQQFIVCNRISGEDLLEEAKRMDNLPPCFVAPLLSSGLRFAAAATPTVLAYMKEHNVGKSAMTKVIGKRLVKYLYGEGETVKGDALANISKLIGTVAKKAGLQEKVLDPSLPPKLKKDKKSKGKRPKSVKKPNAPM